MVGSIKMFIMKDIILFLKNNWQIIVAVVLFVLTFILQLIKKKPVEDIVSDIYHAASSAVKSVEEPGNGAFKKSKAVKIVENYLKLKYPELNTNQYITMISKCIEEILSTPQKKA